MRMVQNRRDFVRTVASAAAMALLGVRNSPATEAPPETTTIRLIKNAGICVAPQYIADELLRLEGFTDIHPAAAAQRMVDRGFTARYDYALQMLKEVPYNKWREYDPADTI